MRIAAVVVVLGLYSGALHAQTNPYVISNNIGKVERPPGSKLGTLEIDQWVGQKFILLPRPASIKKYGYLAFKPVLPYEHWVGRILTVTGITRDSVPVVHFTTDDGAKLMAAADANSVEGIAPLRDLDYARTRWLERSLWLREAELAVYDEEADELGTIYVGAGAHVTVKNIVAGWYNFEPIRFILKADDGREGFLDVQLSGTNGRAVFGDLKPKAFDDYFSEVEPTRTPTQNPVADTVVSRPTPTEMFIPPLPMPDAVRGFHLVAEFEVDAEGHATLTYFTPTKDRRYNLKLEEALKTIHFRPGTTATGSPVKAKAQIVYDF